MSWKQAGDTGKHKPLGAEEKPLLGLSFEVCSQGVWVNLYFW